VLQAIPGHYQVPPPASSDAARQVTLCYLLTF